MNFKHFHTQQDTNFWYSSIIHVLRPENLPKTNPERQEFWENALIDPCKIATNKESIYFAWILHYSHHASSFKTIASSTVYM